MEATIQLREGDMFAQPSDLIVIPCSTGATVTSAVAKRLRHFEITLPQEVMRLGEVKFAMFEKASNIATYVAYAASVDGMNSDESAIVSIAEKVALFAAKKSEIRDITFPLLGSGAGGLPPITSALAIWEGLEKANIKDKVFNIYVLDETVFFRLSSRLSPTNREEVRVPHFKAPAPDIEKKREPVRVFISYTRTDAEHQEWVRNLAVFLRTNGIDARLDIWHLRPGMDLPQWMSNEIDLADRILIVCNEDYASRADGRTGGVGWEIKLVQADLLQTQKANPKKYVPIFPNAFSKDRLPKFLGGTYAISWKDGSKPDMETMLLKELYEAYEEAPPLGSPPRFVLR